MLAGDQSPMKTAPAFCTSPSSATPSSSGTMSWRCSGAIALATATAWAGPSTRQAMPAVASVDSRSARRLDAATMRSTSRPTRSARAASHVTNQASPSGPCSACTTRSMAAKAGGAPGPATTTISDGPAKAEATPTRPDTCRLASATYALPGPAITSTAGTLPRPVGQGGDRLGATDPVDLVHPGDRGGAEGGGVDPAVGGRGHAEGDARDTRHARRRRAHEDGRRIARSPSRRVEAGPRHGAGQRADADAALDQVGRWCALVAVVGQDAAVGHLERPGQGGGDGGTGLLDLPGRHAQSVGHVDLVELGRVAHHGLVALAAHLGEDGGHHVVHLRPRRVGPRQQRVEGRLGAAEVHDAKGHEVTRLPGGSRASPRSAIIG